MRTLNHLRALRPLFYVVCAVFFLGGCSSSSDTTSSFSPGPGGGTHPVDFLSTHSSFAVSDVTECTTCHGDDLTGGIANTSCFTAACHHENPGWASPAAHGASAKRAPGNSGFASCQICHGDDFSGGGANVSCFLCHAPAPHPSQWRTGDTYAHTNADQGNASVCAQCHLAGANSPIAPPPSPASGAQPGCFNNTLCHGAVSGHPSGWSNPDSHGTAAKGAPSGSTGFAYCQVCHGNDFTGGIGTTCLNNSACHGAGVFSPHPSQWLPTSARKHTAADGGNASVCASCHTAGANSPISPPSPPAPAGTPPGCFNSTLCHGVLAAPHVLGSTWTTPNPAFHGLSAKQDLSFCQTCHGTPGTVLFEGGSALTKCSPCHPAAKAHPTTWFEAPQPFPGYVASHRNSGSVATACAICHDVDGPGPEIGPNPAAPSCFSASFTNTDGVAASCHASGPGQAPHAVPFPNHTGVTDATFNDPFPDGCASCHAVTGTSPVTSAPLCTTCHTGGSPLTLGNCTSCHAEPPAGAAYPDIVGSHVKHDALAGVTAICSTCHNGLDSGTQAHYDRANARPGKDGLRVPPGDAAFLAKFNAKSGTASFDSAALTCSNVSCHGGIPTPGWQTGSIAVNTDAGCRQCHTPGTAAGTPENNSPFSGLHGFHLGGTVNALCTECHDMTNGTSGASNHFAFLDTPALEGPASQTVEPTGNPAFYNATNQTCGTFTCHGRLHVDFSWTGGGVNHSVPFLSTTHTAVTQAGFSGVCAACHAESGTSPLSSAPVCQTCHKNTGVSPLTTKDCTSCHAKPPAGSSYPNAAGRHAKHNGLAGVTGICGTCHTTYESGTLEHYNRANGRPGKDGSRVPPGDTKFLSTFNAKTGAAAFDTAAFTCSKVSCHGGVTTPRWDSGTITVTTDAGCLQCHILGTGAGTPENNSLYTGRHAKHLTGLGSKGNAVCTECHDMANGTSGASNHFAFLDTPQMEGPAGQTVEPLGVAANYNASSQTCTLTCHTQVHAVFPWTGPVTPNHPVPFLNATHTTVSQGGFDGNCAACHALAGTSPVAAAPRCDGCHTNLASASPLTNKDCTSCHASPPSGAAYANIEGAHGEHVALNSAGTPVSCNTCHNGLGSGTQSHYDRATTRQQPASVAFTSTPYNAKTGAPTFTSALASLSCSNVSCHGGQTTPNFRTGTIDVNTQCTSCHAFGTSQFNSFNSGEHDKHVNDKHISCTECHNTTTLAVNHFNALGTQAMEGPASATIGGGSTEIPAGNYDTTTQSCNPSCHGTERWQGGD